MNPRSDSPVYIPGPAREFHVYRGARDTYQFSDSVFSIRGHVLFGDVRSAREFALRINSVRRSAIHPERAISAGEIYAMGLLDEVLHYIFNLYLQQYGRTILQQLHTRLADTFSPDEVERMLLTFSQRFPTVACYNGHETPLQSLERTVEDVSGRDVALEEILMLHMGNQNPAYAPAVELFDEQILREDTIYPSVLSEIERFFETQPAFGPGDESLLDLLRAPARAHPNDLFAQLEYVRTRWGTLIGPLLDRITRSLDVMKEERKGRFFGPGESAVLEFGDTDGGDDYARFSPDREWMPRAVIIAKSTLVWLDQLSRQYQRPITTLDAIPDEELDRLKRFGFNGLWLIGLWQRSEASRRIKNLCGNPEAEASAYSLYDYEIAGELGGWSGLENLRQRLWQRGIRIASDMVPNHTGIDSAWVHQHPDWFIRRPYSPFPGYTFSGENLSTNPGVGIYLEDHYYDRTDAAVVFRRVDHGSGEETFIYHGNDGTAMPWNDTAQLDYLNPAVREAVIQTILTVARNFPIIRFDAAMTLARKHIQRLWYPAPGQGGDIPSRGEAGLTQEEFNRALPVEFWREVVDRVAAEVPDTLLLAEAFWMMESYFVRTLGMHRVYNSAFMNMLKNEENDKYRQTVKNTLEYDPEVLKRFVNFMNNPDEETAVAQFGEGDKYFGVATLMVTMPGLPMFGHGQIEGFREKYGMEYRKAYWDEQPNQELIRRHEREVFPLMHRRSLFANAEHFRLYDVYNSLGGVEEHVYVYSNRHGDDRAVVMYNNMWEHTAGWVHTSTPFVRHGDEERRQLQEQLIPALGFTPSWQHFVIFQEQRSGQWFIRNCGALAERGLYVELNGYESQVFLNMYEVLDHHDARYARLTDHLGGRGTPDIQRTLKRLLLQPLIEAFATVCNSSSMRTIAASLQDRTETVPWDEVAEQYRTFLAVAQQYQTATPIGERGLQRFSDLARGMERLNQLPQRSTPELRTLFARYISGNLEHSLVFPALLFLLPIDQYDLVIEWELLELESEIYHRLSPPQGALRGGVAGGAMSEPVGEPAADANPTATTGTTAPSDTTEDSASPGAFLWEGLLEVVLYHHNWWNYPGNGMETLFADPLVERYLRINYHNGVTWFNKERFRALTELLTVVAAWQFVTTASNTPGTRFHWKPVTTFTEQLAALRDTWTRAENASGYEVARFLEALEQELENEPGQKSEQEPERTSKKQVEDGI